MQFNVLDLFSGAGGFSLGLDSLDNITTVEAVDFDKYACETFQKNFKDAYVICGDLTKKAVKDEVIRVARERNVNMIVGGPPCQGFSLKGKNLGFDDERNFLFLEYLDIVKQIRPEVFVIENVKNLLNSEGGYFIEEIKRRFSDEGYIINYDVLNARNYGVPESRERAIIIGSLTRCINMPEPLEKRVTVRDAISDLAYLNSGEGEFESEYVNVAESDYQRMLRGKKVYNHIATNHSKFALEKLAMIPPEGDKRHLPKELHGKQKFATTWSRLEWDTYSPTIDTRFDTPSNGRNSHPFLNRSITPREAARIQSFNDYFIFYGPKSSVCKQIGNAVPPLLGKAIGKAILDAYNTDRIVTEKYELYHGDALAIVKEFKQNNSTVDHIITDPPYNISQKNNFDTLRNPRKGLDFGEWDKSFDLYSWIKEYSEILNKNGSMIVFCSYRYLSHIIDELEDSGMVVKDVLIWKKSNPMPRNIERRYVQDTEFAVWAVKKGSKWIFNKPEDQPYLRSSFTTSTVSGKEKTGHPTQKSLKLMEDIIKIHTNENEVVLDPFMGSGSTGVACLKHNRKFIGIEIDKEYFDTTINRLNK